jgi:hypothetical protein
MNSTRSTIGLRVSKFLRSHLPLMTVATLCAMSSAANCFALSAGWPLPTAPQRRVVARGHLTDTRELQQVVTWRTSDAAHLAIETAGRNPRTLWQADERFSAIDINSVQIVDLDGDSIPEVLSLWWPRARQSAELRVFHWNRSSQSFAELHVRSGDADKLGIHSYRLRGSAGHQRIIVYTRATGPDGEFELRGSEIVRVGGGIGVTTKGESGIEGEAIIGPVRPGPTREGQSDTAPFKTSLVISRVSDGIEVARLETGSDGRFRVALPPGTYKVVPANRVARLPRAGEETVTVAPGKFSHVTINFDSGMR